MPADRDNRLDEAVAAIHGGAHERAEKLCRELVEANEKDAEAWSFLGVALLGRRNDDALAAMERAISLEPAEPRWQLHYGIGLTRAGHPERAEPVLAEAARRSGFAPDTLLPWVESLEALGRIDEAATVVEKLVSARSSAAALTKLSRLRARLGDIAGARKASDALPDAARRSPPERLWRARLDVEMQQYERAGEALDKLVAEFPTEPEIAVAAAELAQSRGDTDRAREILAAARSARPDDPALVHATLDLTGSDVDDSLLTRADGLRSDMSIPLAGRRAITFALARHFDRAGDAARAWQLVCEANDLYARQWSFDADAYRLRIDRALEVSAAVDVAEAEPGEPGLIYLAGPPRSGATLLQTVIAAAEGVRSVGERAALLPWLLALVETEDAGDRWNDRVDELRRADIAGLRRIDPGAAVYVDKTPHNVFVLGLIGRLHPQARFVDVRRRPAEVALSILFHDFPPAFDYSRDLDAIVDFLLLHYETLAQWRDAGIDITVHDHDAFAAAPADRGRRLFEALGLEWRESCLDASARSAVVRTFSRAQVREPVGMVASDRVARYGDFVGETLERLDRLS